jgi:hypothetical protein
MGDSFATRPESGKIESENKRVKPSDPIIPLSGECEPTNGYPESGAALSGAIHSPLFPIACARKQSAYISHYCKNRANRDYSATFTLTSLSLPIDT